jgi:di/tricarboxylate transporter
MDISLVSTAVHSWALLLVVIAMVVLFVTERLPLDVTAMVVVVILLLGRYVTAEEAFSGFSSPVVIVMVSTLFVAAALKATGVSDTIARFIQRYAGSNERISIAIIMCVSAILSSCMNNVSAATLLMPAVAVLSHEVQIPPSRLFIPLAFGVTLGGMVTVIGTPPNIIAAELVRRRGMEPFSFFEFAPYAVVAIIAGVAFMALIGYRLLPVRKTHGMTRRITDLRALYLLQDRIFSIRVPDHSVIDGKSLGELRFGSFIGGVVVTIMRGGRKLLSPSASEKLHSRDILLVRGNPERFGQIHALQGLSLAAVSSEIIASLERNYQIVSFTIREVHKEGGVVLLRELLQATGIVPLLLRRGAREGAWESRPPSWFLDSAVHKGDELVGCIVGHYTEESPLVDLEVHELTHSAHALAEELCTVRIEPEGWAGAPLHRLAHDTKLAILGRISEANVIEWFDVSGGNAPSNTSLQRLTADHVLRAGETYLVSGLIADARCKAMLSELSFEAEAVASEIDSDDVGIVELIITPRSELIGRTLADLHFREKYRCQVLAVWREGKPMLSLSSGLPLLYGDALLVQGSRKSIPLLAKDPNFVLLSEHRETPRLSRKSVFALGALLLLMLTPLITGLLPHEVAFISACIVVVTGAISIEQVYREIDWRVVFMLALMIPLGHAVEHIAVADHLLPIVKDAAMSVPPIVLAAGFLLVGSLISQTVDNSVAVIFLGPLALEIGRYMPGAPTALLLAVTLGSSLSFMLPTSCRSNLLVMGAGGYRSADYTKIGTPFTVVVGLAIILVLLFRDL